MNHVRSSGKGSKTCKPRIEKLPTEHIIVSYHKNKGKNIKFKFIIRVFNKSNKGYTKIKSTKESKEKLSWI